MADLGIDKILTELNPDQIRSLSSALDIQQRWSIEEETILMKNLNSYKTVEEFRQELMPNRTLYSIQHKIKRLGLNRSSTWEQNNDFNHLTKEELSYIAGIIDGEGYIRDDSFPSIWVTNTCLDLIKWLQSKLSGNVQFRPPKKDNHKDQWVWYITRKHNVIKILQLLYPYLIVKKPKVDALFMKYGLKSKEVI